VPRLKRYFEHLSRDAKDSANKGGADKGGVAPIRPRRGRVSAE
jgi:hypothetical protein